MMKDNHVAGEGNAYYTLFREYDPDLGRWWRPDPIFQPWQSIYSANDYVKNSSNIETLHAASLRNIKSLLKY